MVETNQIINEDHYVFYDTIKNHDGIYRLTAPKMMVEGAGWKAGDKVKIWIKRVKKDE